MIALNSAIKATANSNIELYRSARRYVGRSPTACSLKGPRAPRNECHRRDLVGTTGKPFPPWRSDEMTASARPPRSGRFFDTRGEELSILRPRTEAASLRRVEPAVLPTGRCRFHWILDQHPLDVRALRTFEGPQIGMGGARFDPGQQHPARTLGAARLINRK